MRDAWSRREQAPVRTTAVSSKPEPAAREPEPGDLEPRAAALEATERAPAWTVALSEAMASARPGAVADPAASTAEIIRRKLADLNRA